MLQMNQHFIGVVNNQTSLILLLIRNFSWPVSVNVYVTLNSGPMLTTFEANYEKDTHRRCLILGKIDLGKIPPNYIT